MKEEDQRSGLKLCPPQALSSNEGRELARGTRSAHSAVLSFEPKQEDFMPIHRALSTALSFTAFASLIIASACVGRAERENGGDSATHASTSPGSVASASDSTLAINANVPAVGPGIQVTSTDQHEVARSMDLKLTNDNWSKFVRAADTVATLRTRDAEVRQYLDQQIVGSNEEDAGRKWLEANPKVNAAITAAGLSVKDYYRLGLAIAAAKRFANDPAAAPPTPAGKENAEFIRAHAAELARLESLTSGTQPVKAQ